MTPDEAKSIQVSIIIPTYGGRDTLSRAVVSVLAQTHHNIEIIVVDDNPPDSQGRHETETVMQAYHADSRVRYICHTQNSERSAARNTGIKCAHGKYIMFLDDDDEFLPGKIRAQVAFMQNAGDAYSCCYTRYVNVNAHGKTVMRCGETRDGSLFTEALKRNLFVHAGSNLLVRKEVLDEVGGFDERISACEDVELLSRLVQRYKIGFVDIGGLIVHTEKSISSNYNDNVINYLRIIKPLLATLPKTEQKQIVKRVQLQSCRYDIGSKNFLGLRKRMRANGISVYELLRYIAHLFYRRLVKLSYGYQMKSN